MQEVFCDLGRRELRFSQVKGDFKVPLRSAASRYGLFPPFIAAGHAAVTELHTQGSHLKAICSDHSWTALFGNACARFACYVGTAPAMRALCMWSHAYLHQVCTLSLAVSCTCWLVVSVAVSESTLLVSCT